MKVVDQGIKDLWRDFLKDDSNIAGQQALQSRLNTVYPEEDNTSSVIEITYDSAGEINWHDYRGYGHQAARTRPNFIFAAVLSIDRIASEGSKSARVFLRDRLDGMEYEVMARDSIEVIKHMVGGHCLSLWTFGKRSSYISLRIHDKLEI